MQKTFWSFDDNVKSSVITEKDNTTNDKFAYSQNKQDGLEFQILGTIWLLDFPRLDTFKLNEKGSKGKKVLLQDM